MLTAATLPLLLVLIITLHSTLTLSDHFACSWKPHKGSPGDFLFELFCEGRLLRDHKEPDTKADWVCAGGDVGKVGTHIADWGHLKKNVLELATPCAHGGYGLNEHSVCQGPEWALCKGESKEGNCYYLQSIDDCEWLNEEALNDLPSVINVWFNNGNGSVLPPELGQEAV